MTKQEFAEKLAGKEGMPKTKAEEIMNFFLDEITKALVRGEDVVFTGFGKFVAVAKPARQGRNPKTGEKVQIAAKTVPKFKAGKALKEAVK